MDADFPKISKQLLERLEQQIPPRTFYPEQSIESIMFYSGQRSLVEMLRHQYDLQNESIPTHLK
jgi:hypothetical protein